jgi:UDP-glucose 4-epimerase
VVTGGAGFVGSHMVDLLIQRADMATLAANGAHFTGAQYVVHFGGLGDIVPSIERPLDYMRASVDGTLVVLEAARFAGVDKFVYAASSSCYGLTRAWFKALAA